MVNDRVPMLWRTTRHTLMMSVTIQHYVDPRNGVHTYVVRWRDDNLPDHVSDNYLSFRSFASCIDFICTNFNG